jgi:hypothetical protein
VTEAPRTHHWQHSIHWGATSEARNATTSEPTHAEASGSRLHSAVQAAERALSVLHWNILKKRRCAATGMQRHLLSGDLSYGHAAAPAGCCRCKRRKGGKVRFVQRKPRLQHSQHVTPACNVSGRYVGLMTREPGASLQSEAAATHDLVVCSSCGTQSSAPFSARATAAAAMLDPAATCCGVSNVTSLQQYGTAAEKDEAGTHERRSKAASQCC